MTFVDGDKLYAAELNAIVDSTGKAVTAMPAANGALPSGTLFGTSDGSKDRSATATQVATLLGVTGGGGGGGGGIAGVISAEYTDGFLVLNLPGDTQAKFMPTSVSDPLPVLPDGVEPHSLALINVAPGTIWPDLPTAQLGLADGGQVNVAAGLYQRVTYFSKDFFPSGFTIIGVGAYLAVNDGRLGAGAGHRLAHGKGIIATDVPGNVLIKGMGFINGGGGDRIDDGEAGVYFEHTSGSNRVEACAFDGNENGIFVNAVAQTAGEVVLYNNDYGMNNSNSMLGNGRAHDIYCNAFKITETFGRHYGNGMGHCFKARSLHVITQDNYFAHKGGRCVDLPDGTATPWASTRDIFTDLPGANSNMLGYHNEAGLLGAAGANIVDAQVAISRFATVFWFDAGVCAFTGLTLTAFKIVSGVDPSLTLQGPGTFTGIGALPAPSGTGIPRPVSPLVV